MKNSINEQFGKRVAELRRKKHLSQEALADLCGIHRTYIGTIERGEKSPTLNMVEKVAKGLDVRVKDLFL